MLDYEIPCERAGKVAGTDESQLDGEGSLVRRIDQCRDLDVADAERRDAAGKSVRREVEHITADNRETGRSDRHRVVAVADADRQAHSGEQRIAGADREVVADRYQRIQNDRLVGNHRGREGISAACRRASY